jgi:hypothetical protein
MSNQAPNIDGTTKKNPPIINLLAKLEVKA